MKELNNEDALDDQITEFKGFKDTLSRKYTFYLTGEISSDTHKYYDLFRVLDSEASEGDIVNIKICSPGGCLDTGTMLAHSIMTCSAKVVMHSVANNYSMASILALTGDALIIYPGTYLMFHNYSSAEYGKGGELVSSIKANRKIIKDVMDYFCTPFLTDKEISTILGDQDIYIHWDDSKLEKRIERHFEDKGEDDV